MTSATGEKRCHLCRVFGYSSSVYHPPSTPHALSSLPSSIPLNNTILARLQSHHFSIIHWLVPLLRQGAVKELKQLNLLSYTAVNNAIRVTDCQEGAEWRLLWMCVRVCLCVCAWRCIRSHTWCSVYDSSKVHKSSNAHRASSKASRNPFDLQTGNTERPGLVMSVLYRHIWWNHDILAEHFCFVSLIKFWARVRFVCASVNEQSHTGAVLRPPPQVLQVNAAVVHLWCECDQTLIQPKCSQHCT